MCACLFGNTQNTGVCVCVCVCTIEMYCFYLWTHKCHNHKLPLMRKCAQNCALSCIDNIVLTTRCTPSTNTINECNDVSFFFNVALFLSLSLSLSFSLCLSRLSVDHSRSVITFQPLFSADIFVQLIMPILPSREGQSVCE